MCRRYDAEIASISKALPSSAASVLGRRVTEARQRRYGEIEWGIHLSGRPPGARQKRRSKAASNRRRRRQASAPKRQSQPRSSDARGNNMASAARQQIAAKPAAKRDAETRYHRGALMIMTASVQHSAHAALTGMYTARGRGARNRAACLGGSQGAVAPGRDAHGCRRHAGNRRQAIASRGKTRKRGANRSSSSDQ